MWNNHGARNLDLQLGRWWGLDPLAEKYLDFSPYVSMGNNPVRFVDLDGRSIDDYFDAKGNFLGTDNSGTNFIRIVTGNIPNNFYNSAGKINAAVGEKYKLLTDYRYKAHGNSSDVLPLTTLTTISSFYAKKVGYNLAVGTRTDPFASMSTVHSDEASPIKIVLLAGGNISSSKYADKYNLMNDFVHEFFHLSNHKNVDVSLNKGSVAHLQAYSAQINHVTWISTTEKHQKQVIENVGWYIGAIGNSQTRSKKKKEFEKMLNILFLNFGEYPNNTTWKRKK